jgi:hypothetical protein
MHHLVALRHRLSVAWLAGCIITFYGMVWITARRYWLLTGEKVPFRRLLNLVILQTVLGNLVSTSVGALSYVAILRSKHQLHVSRGITSLLLAKVSDLLMLLLALALSSTVLWPQITTLHWPILLLLNSMVGLLAIISLTVILRRGFLRATGWVAQKLHLD